MGIVGGVYLLQVLVSFCGEETTDARIANENTWRIIELIWTIEFILFILRKRSEKI